MACRARPRRAEKTISIDAGLLSQVSCQALKDAHIEHLKEEFQNLDLVAYDVILILTDWKKLMPRAVTAILVQFLASREESKLAQLVHLDLHGHMQPVLEVMQKNSYYETVACSLKCLELSLLDVDPSSDFLPKFTSLRALRMYKPEFPATLLDHYSLRLFESCPLRDAALVALENDCFEQMLGMLACISHLKRAQKSSNTIEECCNTPKRSRL